MFRKVRERLGSAGLVVAVLALIVALRGGAFAATQSAKKKSSKYVTKPQVVALIKANATSGPTGPAGAPGGQGAPGAKGDAGAAGANGAPGATGVAGPNGKNVKLTTIPSGPGNAKCSERGGVTAEVEGESATAKDICNGVAGAPGPPGADGRPWAPESQLPPGATETGAWSFTGTEADIGGIVVPISFTVQFPTPPGELGEEEVHFQTDSDFSDSGHGTTGEPSAEPGQLCVYFTGFGVGEPVNATFEEITRLNQVGAPGARARGASSAGAALYFEYSGGPGEAAYGNGSWAVTAPLAP